MYILLGSIVTLVGVLGLIFRRPLAGMATKIFTMNGISVHASGSSRIERVYVLGGIFMIVAGMATLTYGLFFAA